jgi:hypothetical protein
MLAGIRFFSTHCHRFGVFMFSHLPTQIPPEAISTTPLARPVRAFAHAARQEFSSQDLRDQSFAQLAQSDGWVLALLGTVGYESAFLGVVCGSTHLQDQTTSCVYASARTQALSLASGKKGNLTYQLPIMGSFTMPVRKGELWRITLTADAAFAPVPELSFYWLPLVCGAQANTLAVIAAQSYQAFHQQVHSGALRGSVLRAAQATIDARVQDLTRILGDATGITEDTQARTRFVQDLQKIVCSPRLPNQPAQKELSAQDVQALITTFGEVTEHNFDHAQQALLDMGIRALVQINDNAENRNNLSLIQRNIGLFLDNMQLVLKRDFGSAQRRLLTRALVRIVGDGGQA